MPASHFQDFALIVGINNYADQNFLETLQGPKNDANRFITWLNAPAGSKNTGDNLTVHSLLSNAQGRKPTSGDIVEIIKKILAIAPRGDLRIGRRLYIFLAGHGVGPDLDDAGLLTAEATEDAPAWVDGRRYANLFRGRAVFEEVVLIMDCCRDFDGALPDSVFPIRQRIDTGGAHKVKYFYAYASGFGRAAREKKIGAKVFGIFSHVMINGLNGGAIDGDGRITGQSLERYVDKHMKTFLPSGIEQSADIRGDRDIVFADGFEPARVTVTVMTTVAHDRLAVLFADGLKPVTMSPKNLGAGRYEIQLRVGKIYVFQLIDAAGAILKQDGRALEDVDALVEVEL